VLDMVGKARMYIILSNDLKSLPQIRCRKSFQSAQCVSVSTFGILLVFEIPCYTDIIQFPLLSQASFDDFICFKTKCWYLLI